MAATQTLIERAYSAFNKRDTDGALALMTQDVTWPKASDGEVLHVFTMKSGLIAAMDLGDEADAACLRRWARL